MANTHSLNPLETIHFRLTDGPKKTSVPCTLTLDLEDKSLSPSKNNEKSCHISFNVGSEDTSEEKTLQWLLNNLKDCSIDADEQKPASAESNKNIQEMVKNMAALWADAMMKKQSSYMARPNTATSYASSSTSISEPSNATTGITTPANASTDDVVARPPNAVPPLHERRSNKDYGAFYLDLRPGTPATENATSSDLGDSTRPRQSYFDERLVEQLSALEWQQAQQGTPPNREIIRPVRPLDIYRPRGREPSSSTPDNSTPSTRPASPVVAVDVPASAPALPQSPPVDEGASKSRWWQIFSRQKEAAIDKPAAVVADADKSTIILPSPPTDHEVYLYAQTRRLPLYLFGTFSFLSVSVGMWFFAISSKMFYWFGIFVGLIQIYLFISYIVGYCGKDFNVAQHKQLVEEHPCSENSPAVDIYLPCCKEPLEVLENTYKYVQQLNYPNFKVHVLDDGGLDSVKNLAAQYNFNYISRDNKPHLKKAGNLRYAFARTAGEFFVIYDADFCPRADFIQNTLPYMKKYNDIAIVQSPQFFRPSNDQTWVEQGASSTQELFYRIVQVNRDRWGASICVGSNAMYRRAALEEVGGTAEIGHSEDVHTGFYALTRGWKLKYIPLALACGVSPDTPQAFFSQQMRWCAGSTTLLTNPDFWRSKLSIIQKICFMSGMMYYTAAALMIFLVPIPGLLMLWINPKLVMWFNFAYAFPSLIYSVVIFRLWSRQMYNFNVNYVFAIQQYAYLMAVKDRIFGTTASWVPSGDNKSHIKGEKKKKAGGNNKYRNMRILCCVWVWGTTGAMIAGVCLRIVQGYHWYNFFPLFILDGFNLFTSHKFIFYSR